jgi:adenine phosphoribosyltransferase
MEAAAADLKAHITEIPDHPRPGVVFRDITPLLADPVCVRYALDRLTSWAAGLQPDVVAGVDARGFLFGGALAAALGCGFVPLRKRGKLPRDRISAEFDTEYSTDTLELHTDAFAPGARVLIHDDVIAVGNCSRASAGLVERLGGHVVGLCFLIELTALDGRRKLGNYPVFSLVQY